MPVSGRTRLFAVLGDPVTQVKAPALLNAEFALLGADAVLVPVHAPAARLAEVVGGLKAAGNVDGLLVTVPHKLAVCAYADELSEAAALAGSANALRREPDGRWFADNFDGAGFVRGLAGSGHRVRGLRVFLAGAGGAGLAVAAALLSGGAEHVVVRDPDRARVAALVDRLGARWPGRVTAAPAARADTSVDPVVARGTDLAVNATPLGLRAGDPLPFAPRDLAPGTLVADLVMEPHETPLLRAAAACGLGIHHGIHMLRCQIELYSHFFRLTATPGI
ncbi:shikimate dehydrogenase family protein [Actinacidiphila paucisporea]|uniref:Shikimate dehydrogenase n=1 Tax=Actinacidiphila paucisporea TaxID=310782 RepID=A0A1M7LYI4_9ACTN|nr:shikimate dehydrogenase [Actinacidiphila paucisporea]SHM83395.1 shikimate dehydrogenase [Actinacidiphila paucisporea]